VCTPAQNTLLDAMSVVLLVGWIAIAIIGWLGRLPGARSPRRDVIA
jgi:hypothetical protein